MEEASTTFFPAPFLAVAKGLNVSGGGFGDCACFSLAWQKKRGKIHQGKRWQQTGCVKGEKGCMVVLGRVEHVSVSFIVGFVSGRWRPSFPAGPLAPVLPTFGASVVVGNLVVFDLWPFPVGLLTFVASLGLYDWHLAAVSP